MKKIILLLTIVVFAVCISTYMPTDPMEKTTQTEFVCVDTETDILFVTDQVNPNLFASVTAQSDSNVPEANGDITDTVKSKFSLETIIYGILFILTTLFGGLFKKYLGKFKQAIDLAVTLYAALEDGQFSKPEIAALKTKLDILLGKSKV